MFCFVYSSVNYQRSYSHSQAVEVEEPDYASPTHSKTNYKSLPDLHTHMQTNRNSPYSEYSEGRGNRSNKSNGSLNRDSGGSSGHYTHRSEPFYKQDTHSKLQTQPKQKQPYSNFQPKYFGPDNRRDSGSSTQHSGNSYYAYNDTTTHRIDCIECDIGSPTDANCLLNFTTSVVPEAFQDHFSDNSNDDKSKPNKHYVVEPILRASRASMFYSNSGYGTDLRGPSATAALTLAPNNDLRSPNVEGETSPPLGTFKRQKCLRLKQHPSRHPSPSDRIGIEDRKPILRSKSDISHRYFSRNVQKFDPGYLGENSAINEQQRAKSENFSELERFFDRLGLSDDINNSSDSNRSSPVFFSDVATVNSDQLPDSTETQLETQPYRPIEPTSIVERNARIIKWLCTCRKMQVT